MASLLRNHPRSIAKTAESTVSVNSISGSTSVEATPALGADHLNPPGPDPASAKAQQLKALQTWAAVPPIAKTLGLAGLIPFFALSPPVAAQLPLLAPSLLADVAVMQVGYGVAIASFLGGIHWGAAMLDFRPAAKAFETERYLWGVTPCLLAVPALYMEAGPGAFAVATALGVVHAVDSSFSWRSLVPPWYMSLRRPLTALAIGGLLLTAGDDIMSERRRLEEKAQAAETTAA